MVDAPKRISENYWQNLLAVLLAFAWASHGLDGKEDEIRRFLELGVSKTAIAKLTGVSRTALYSFMSIRGPRPPP